jgi:hypothetical protein
MFFGALCGRMPRAIRFDLEFSPATRKTSSSRSQRQHALIAAPLAESNTVHDANASSEFFRKDAQEIYPSGLRTLGSGPSTSCWERNTHC